MTFGRNRGDMILRDRRGRLLSSARREMWWRKRDDDLPGSPRLRVNQSEG
ncbi:MAG TPA: hypothetical protein VF503_18275 [Sphingobium sp.]